MSTASEVNLQLKFHNLRVFLEKTAEARRAQKQGGGVLMVDWQGYETAQRLLAEVQQAAVEKNASIDLTAPALSNALKILELAGKDVEGATLRDIVAQLSGNQPALHMLKSVFTAKDMQYGISLVDNATYDPGSIVDGLADQLRYVFTQGGSINSLSGAAAKIAHKEGELDFPAVVDEQGLVDAARTGAGLPDAAVRSSLPEK